MLKEITIFFMVIVSYNHKCNIKSNQNENQGVVVSPMKRFNAAIALLMSATENCTGDAPVQAEEELIETPIVETPEPEAPVVEEKKAKKGFLSRWGEKLKKMVDEE